MVVCKNKVCPYKNTCLHIAKHTKQAKEKSHVSIQCNQLDSVLQLVNVEEIILVSQH